MLPVASPCFSSDRARLPSVDGWPSLLVSSCYAPKSACTARNRLNSFDATLPSGRWWLGMPLCSRLDTVMFIPATRRGAWGVDLARGFVFDWWALGGRANGWGREIRSLLTRQHLRPSRRSIPRFLRHNAVWSEDLARVRLASAYSVAILTRHGEWQQCSATLMSSFGKMTVREREAKVAWLRKIRKLMHAYPVCLAIAVDYHC